jgi:hypothetical protein
VSVRPKKELGQHFLVDENIVTVIERLAQLHAEDVVLEIGPGLGVLTRRPSHSTSPRSTPPRRSSSRTCPTTSRRRSSPRASPAFQASATGR